MRRTTRLAPLIPIVLLAGCTTSQADIPHDTPDTTTTPPSPTSPPPTALATLDACELLTPEEATSLDIPPQGRADEIVGLRICHWTNLGGGGIATTIDEEDGIDALDLTDASSVADVIIGSHRAKRAVETSGAGFCNIYFAVGDNASVTVQALYLNDTPQACAVADQAAMLIEPKLP